MTKTNGRSSLQTHGKMLTTEEPPDKNEQFEEELALFADILVSVYLSLTPEQKKAVERLERRGPEQPTAVPPAETVPNREKLARNSI